MNHKVTFLFIVLCSLAACSSSAPESKILKPARPSELPAVASTESGVENVADCEKMASAASNLDPATESSFSSQVLQISREYYSDQACGAKNLNFRAASSDGSYLSAQVLRDDFLLWQGSKISEPEFLRRAQIHSTETLASIKNKLRQARQNKDVVLAQTLVDLWLREEPASTVALLVKANIFLDQEKFMDAASLYEVILAKDATQTLAWYNWAHTKKKLGDFEGAISLFRRVLDDLTLHPSTQLSRDMIYLELADCYFGNNKPDDAASALEHILDKTNSSYLVLMEDLNSLQSKVKPASAPEVHP